MKNMKTIIALALSATGSAALPIPKAFVIAHTAAKHSAAAAAGPKKTFALDQIVVQAVVPVEQDDALPATIAVGETRTKVPGLLAEKIIAPAAMTAFPVKQDDASQRRLHHDDDSDACPQWCAQDPRSWGYKCGTGIAPGGCSGCAQCAGACEGWCHNHDQPWSVRCAWDTLACSACDACKATCAAPNYVKDNVCTACPYAHTCDGATATTCLTGECQNWCLTHADPWSVRCGWDTNHCSGCDACKGFRPISSSTYVKDNVCTACPDGHKCDGATATQISCGNNRQYLKDGVCTACPDGHTCDSITATKCAATNYVDGYVCRACPSGSTCDGTAATKCAATKYVLNNVCEDCPDGHTCDGATAAKCAATNYVLNNVCTACPRGYTCDGTTATWIKLATAAERADCLAGSDGSCAKCCAVITGVCVTSSYSSGSLTDYDDCVLVKGDFKTFDATSPRLKFPWLFFASARRVGRQGRRRDRRRGLQQLPLRQRLPRPFRKPSPRFSTCSS